MVACCCRCSNHRPHSRTSMRTVSPGHQHERVQHPPLLHDSASHRPTHPPTTPTLHDSTSGHPAHHPPPPPSQSPSSNQLPLPSHAPPPPPPAATPSPEHVRLPSSSSPQHPPLSPVLRHPVGLSYPHPPAVVVGAGISPYPVDPAYPPGASVSPGTLPPAGQAPAGQAPAGQAPPPIGFRTAPVNMNKWDEQRDRIFMMVLSAEEFLYQMNETDGRIALFSRAEEREMHKAQIEEMLAIRGHLQDELLRIHDMLAADTEPELQCLHLFLPTHPHVVHKLWELKEKQKELRAKEHQGKLELPQPQRATQQIIAQLANKVKMAASALRSPKKATETTTGDEVNEGQEVTAQEDVDEIELIEINEDDLKKEHVKEEQEVAQKYTTKIVSNRGKISPEELAHLLDAHALSMQALRDRQKDEKAKMNEILEFKKRERLLKRRANKQEDEERGGTSASKDSGISEEGQEEKKEGLEDDSDSDSDLSSVLSSLSYAKALSDDEKESLRTTLEADLWDKRQGQLSEEEFLALVQGLRQQESQRKQMKNAEKSRHKEGLAAKLARRKKREQEGSQDHSDNDNQQNDREEEEEEEYQVSEAGLMEKLRGQMGAMTDEEFSRLLKQHLEETERIRKQRQAQNDKLQEKLQKKLRDRKDAAGEGGGGSQNEEAEEKEEMQAVDEETEQKISELEQSFQKRLLRERHQLSEAELQALLEEHRRQKEKLRRHQATDRQNHEDKLQAKLAEKKRRKLKSSDKKLSGLDEQFFADLQGKQQRGELSKEEFSDLLQSYMNRMGDVKREEREKRRARLNKPSESEIRENVSSLVQQHQEDTRQLNDLRQRQKDIMDQRLRNKLAAKKNKKTMELET